MNAELYGLLGAVEAVVADHDDHPHFDELDPNICELVECWNRWAGQS